MGRASSISPVTGTDIEGDCDILLLNEVVQESNVGQNKPGMVKLGNDQFERIKMAPKEQAERYTIEC